MPLLYHHRPVDFHPKPRSPCLLNTSDFIDTFYLRLYNRYGINCRDISSLSPNPFDIYHQVVGLRRVVQVECDFVTPNFWLKRAKLQVSAEFEFDVTVRLINEQVVDWIDVRQDPSRPDHVECRWPKPFDPNTTVINTDGSWSLIQNRAAIGCMFRTYEGKPLRAYSATCEKMDIHVIETWAVREGLRVATTGGLGGVVLIGTDATIAVSLINTVAAAYSNLVNKCKINNHNYLKESSRVPIRAASPKEDKGLEIYVRSVINRHARWTEGLKLHGSSLDFLVKTLIEIMYFLEPLDGWGCRHIMREANSAADHLTKLAEDEDIVLVKTESYPAKLLKIVEKDAAETWYPRVKQTPIWGHKCTKSSGWMLPS